MTRKALGIYRETLHSPNREGDDAAILEAAADKLRERGIRVELESSEALNRGERDYDLVFPMCEAPQALENLRRWEAQGTKVINSPRSVLECYRIRMVESFRKTPAVPFPRMKRWP